VQAGDGSADFESGASGTPDAPMRSLHSPRYRRFVKRVREAREQAGLTQVDAARALGRPQSFVAKIEAGQRRVDVIEPQELARLIAFFAE
jgi:ribosome-binding protein aMBF1 (putative translation factor)